MTEKEIFIEGMKDRTKQFAVDIINFLMPKILVKPPVLLFTS